MSAVTAAPSLREAVTDAMRDAIAHRQRDGLCADCAPLAPCDNHRRSRRALGAYRDALEQIEATKNNGDLFALLVRECSPSQPRSPVVSSV